MFVGRTHELAQLKQLTKTKNAKFVVVKGRRRIGKSRLLKEFGNSAKGYKFVYFTSMAPEERISAQDERDYFAKQLSKSFSIPTPPALDWADLLWTLADRVRIEGKCIVVFDEINWMGQKDPTFLAKLKDAWDGEFSAIKNLLLFLSGSLTSWIEKNILHHTGFVGRVNLDMTLGPLPLSDCLAFWGARSKRISDYEKLLMLCVTGGVPRYLEEINPRESAEQNLLRLCYDKSGLLFREFDDLFSDLFSKRNTSYHNIVQALAQGVTDLDGLYDALNVSKSGWLTERVEDLIACGFIERDFTWRIKDGTESKLSRLRLRDNYLRFYLKAIAPYKSRINRNSIKSLPNIDPVLGLQFENLILENREKIWKSLNIKPQNIINENPFFQRKTKRQKGCQIDYLIQMTRNTIYVCEIKFYRNKVDKSIISEVEEKIDRLSLPRNMNYRPVLICSSGASESVIENDYFDEIICLEDLL